MAYETGTATNVNDLLDKFRLFAIAQGWTANRWVVAGSGRELCIQKSSAFFNFRSYSNETMTVTGSASSGRTGIALNGSDGFSAGAAWDRQPGYPQRQAGGASDQAHANVPVFVNLGPFPAYHFFAPDTKTLYCELEVTTGTFLRFGCGSLDLFNPAAPGGGRFFYATGGVHPSTSTGFSTWLGSGVDDSNYALELVPFRSADYSANAWAGSGTLSGSYVRVAHDSFDNWAWSSRLTSAQMTNSICQGGGCHDRPIREFSPSPLNGIGVLLPNIVAVNRSQEFLNPIGVIPGMRYMDMTNYLPGAEFTIGTDTWKVFPWYAKGGLSLQRGIAILKVS